MARMSAVGEGSWEFLNKEQIAENNEENDDSYVEDEDSDWERMYDDEYNGDISVTYLCFLCLIL